MHELSVTENILNIALKHAQKAAAVRVTDVTIVVGRLAAIVDDSVQFYWDIISDKTICKGALLHFKKIPAVFSCENCESEFELEDVMEPCPHCQSTQLKVISGEEFFLESIEIER
jgi:hydrogenase nickel incorporation protein HypA/HybF